MSRLGTGGNRKNVIFTVQLAMRMIGSHSD